MHMNVTPIHPEEGGFDTEYTISWQINLDASSPVEAARKALWYLINESAARVFEVSDGPACSDRTTVDLIEADCDAHS